MLSGVYITPRTFWDYTAEALKVDSLEGVYFVKHDNLPMILDGGCSVISISYDMKTKELFGYTEKATVDDKIQEKFVHGWCNGIA